MDLDITRLFGVPKFLQMTISLSFSYNSWSLYYTELLIREWKSALKIKLMGKKPFAVSGFSTDNYSIYVVKSFILSKKKT